jgi:cytochrome c oxidase assembly protein subunit 15
MVSSGLEDSPVVSEFRLTIHLLAALTLLGIVLWMALDQIDAARARAAYGLSRSIRVLSWVVFASVIFQIAYGGLVAGLKAGHLSNTWPLMFGYLLPRGILTTADPTFMSLFEPLGSHWIHRWFAFVVAALGVALFVAVRRRANRAHRLEPLTMLLLVVIAIQISLGVSVILLGVPKYFALLHQVVGIAVFCIALLIVHAVESRARSDRDITGNLPASVQ